MLTFRYACGVVCASALLRKPAMADVDAIASLAGKAANIYAAAAHQLPTTEQASHTLDAQDAKLLSQMQADELAQQQAQQQDVLTAGGACSACARDYALDCPNAWASAGAGVCVAPASYDGPCVIYGVFSDYAAQDKQLFERRCSACWPCVSGQPHGEVHGPVDFLASHAASAGNRYVFNLHPPEEDEYEMQRGLDAVMQAGENQRGVAEQAFAADKRHMLDIEKAELRHAVRTALP